MRVLWHEEITIFLPVQCPNFYTQGPFKRSLSTFQTFIFAITLLFRYITNSVKMTSAFNFSSLSHLSFLLPSCQTCQILLITTLSSSVPSMIFLYVLWFLETVFFFSSKVIISEHCAHTFYSPYHMIHNDLHVSGRSFLEIRNQYLVFFFFNQRTSHRRN